MKKLLSLVLAALFCLSACALAEETPVTVKVGVVGSTNEQWTDVLVPKLAEEGINIEIVTFSDYVMPNIALASGDIDLNAFQHYNFLENWNDENAETYGTKLVPIGETLIAPLSMYSDKYASVDEIQEGDTILVMNDVVNEARALNMLDLPTPGSPMSTGLFLRRRERICTMRSISFSRPMTGSSSPARAALVRSREN